MPLQTTVVGAYPKPEYLGIPDWFAYRKNNTSGVATNANAYTDHIKQHKVDDTETLKAIGEVIEEQKALGIDVVSDGEIRRENYIHYFCRYMKGMDFEKTTKKTARNGATSMDAPTIRDKLLPLTDAPWCADDWLQSQQLTDVPVKYTIPGPMTIADSTANAFYEDAKQELLDIRDIVNREVRALVAAGCKHIQIDEPLLVRKPAIALEYGLDILSQCFEGVPADVERIVHLCCGYPNYLENYAKADKMCYLQIADKIDNCGFTALSIEDAHRKNDLVLFEKLKKVKVILGSVAIASSKVESVEEIKDRLEEVLQHLPAERLVIAPDCGLGYLPKDVLKQKLTNMVAAAKSLP